MARAFRTIGPNGCPASALVADNMEDFAAWCEAGAMPALRHDPSFFPDLATSLRKLHTGDNKHVAKSDSMLERIEAQEVLSMNAPELQRVVAGSLADIPAYLSGSPINMRRRAKRDAPKPLRISVDTMCSGGISHEALARRGAAVLALLRRLSMAGHAVELYLCGSGDMAGNRGEYIFAVRMETSPLDLARTAWAMSDAGFCRSVSFSAGSRLVGHRRYQDYCAFPFAYGNWAWEPEFQAQAHATLLGVDAADLIHVPFMVVTEADKFKTDAKAAQWVSDTYNAAVARDLQE